MTSLPSPIMLYKIDPARNLFRYYSLSIQPNLFGSWSLIKGWGRISCLGRMQVELCEDLEDVAKVFERKFAEKVKRGYIYI